MTNFDVLKTLPFSTFASFTYEIARRECDSLQEYEAVLMREYPENGMEALRKVQCSRND